MSHPSLDIVIVNWKTAQYAKECLDSIAKADRSGIGLERVVVVDNSGQLARPEPGDLPLTVLTNSHNAGFAAACNQGAEGSTAGYLLFLNPDTRLFEDSLAAPVRFMESPEAAQVAVCGVQNVDDSGGRQLSASRFPSLHTIVGRITGLSGPFPGLFPPEALDLDGGPAGRPVDQVIGAFFLIRRSIYEQLHGFDERFFLYFEEVDLSLRARQLGFTSYCLTGTRVCHSGKRSASQAPAFTLAHFLLSRLAYSFKHFGQWQAAVVLALTFTLEPAARLGRALAGRGSYSAGDVLKAYLLLLAELPSHRHLLRSPPRP